MGLSVGNGVITGFLTVLRGFGNWGCNILGAKLSLFTDELWWFKWSLLGGLYNKVTTS